MVTTQDRFAACAATVMAARGAFTAHDALVDGPAAHGVGLGLLSVWIGGPADAPALRALGPDGAARILRSMVWAPLGAARLAPGPDLALFAYAVEAGTMQALIDLQRHLDVEESGAPDAATLAAARASDPAALARAIATAHAAWRRARGLPVPGAVRRAAAVGQGALATC
jgi:lysozyme family protein